ncbi:MAG TPA: response regulator transcription factor [Pseudonocardia sp.]|uniref:response regulator transcription factor n=1 Tax=Pseudonocardia sp. TaxID=60912 RepID=UPI002BFE1860|nr:response regulator transcription factor [Pseudonocardia sp.]HTF51528.1 response regulator transcription factor [Pseudonocardia sp.]
MNTVAGHVLVIDDDPTVRDVVGRYLARAGYQVSQAQDGEQGLRLAAARMPDLVVLDLMLPGRSGLEICAELRAHSPVPVIMLTALGEEEDRVVGLELGADDYVTKPFSPRELVLRVGSVLRRSRDVAGAVGANPGAAPTVVDGDMVVDVNARRAVLAGRDLALTVREFDLLAFLIRHPGQAFGRPELLDRVWGWSFGDQSTVTVHVRRLREKVEVDPTNPRRISTVWGVGYRYDLDSGDSDVSGQTEVRLENRE